MRPRARLRLLGGGSALLALSGLWIGHTAEYVRVWGTRGLSIELFGSVHVYMLPLGGVLAVCAALSSYRAYRIWLRLGQRIDAARCALWRARSGRAVARHRPQRMPSASARILVAWPVLSAAQIALYLAQENLEAMRAGLPAPGFGAITGAHALAPLVHALVALTLLMVVATVRFLLRRRCAALRRVEAALQRILERCRHDLTPRGWSAEGVPRLQLIAFSCWRRPPPLLVAA